MPSARARTISVASRRTTSTCSSSSPIVVVARDEPERCLRRRPDDARRMDVPLAPLGRLGRERVPRQRRDDIREQLERVHQSPLCRARMDADPLDRELELVRGERLGLDLADPRPVERVCEVGAEVVEVEMIRSLADLLVHRERDPRGRTRGIVVHEVRKGRHDHRNTRLVVRAEQGRPVAGHEVVADPLGKGRQVRRVEHLRRIAGETDRLARPGSVDDRADAGPGRVRRRVDVGDEPERRSALDGARERGEDVARLGQLDVVEPDRAQLVDQDPREVELLLGRRVSRRIERRLGVDRDVAEKALEQPFAQCFGERACVAGVSQESRVGGAARRWW